MLELHQALHTLGCSHLHQGTHPNLVGSKVELLETSWQRFPQDPEGRALG